jgi:NAD(P)-dependent dehydrogenase (short-subunit alcohol dehydrogenase family)
VPATPRLAIVTGTSSGIGEVLTRTLLDRQWRVVGVSRRAAPIQNAHYSHVTLDLAGVETLTASVAAKLGPAIADPALERLALVNNAADVALHGQVDQLEAAGLMRAYAINTVAPILLMGWILRESAAGVPLRIVNVSTGAAVEALPGLGAYSGTKAALRLVGMIFAAELGMRPDASRDVSVLAYDPGVVETPMAQAVRESSAEKLPIVQMFKQLAAHRMLRTPDVPANAIADYLEADGHPRFKEERFAFVPPPATPAT